MIVLDAPQTAVGSPSPGGGNVISGNFVYGVFLGENFSNGQTPDNVMIQGNLIGTDATGESALGNGSNGIVINEGANPVIGGSVAGAGNVVASNGSDGINISFSAIDPLVQGNFIGTDKTGSIALPNSGSGIVVSTNNATIGGTSAGTGTSLLSMVEPVLRFSIRSGQDLPLETPSSRT